MIARHGYRILAEAIEEDLPYEIRCKALLICGDKDHAGSCIRYNKEWHKRSGINIEWIKGAGHNSNTDEPEQINKLVERFVKRIREGGRKTEHAARDQVEKKHCLFLSPPSW